MPCLSTSNENPQHVPVIMTKYPSLIPMETIVSHKGVNRKLLVTFAPSYFIFWVLVGAAKQIDSSENQYGFFYVKIVLSYHYT